MDIGLPAGGVAVETSGLADSVVLITVRGEIDVCTVRPLEEALLDAWQPPSPRLVLLDLAEVGFIGSVGIRALIHADQDALLHDAAVGLCRPSHPVRRALEVTSADSVLRFFDSPEAAVAEAGTAPRRPQAADRC